MCSHLCDPLIPTTLVICQPVGCSTAPLPILPTGCAVNSPLGPATDFGQRGAIRPLQQYDLFSPRRTFIHYTNSRWRTRTWHQFIVAAFWKPTQDSSARHPRNYRTPSSGRFAIFRAPPPLPRTRPMYLHVPPHGIRELWYWVLLVELRD
ncbi:uncharacterized protein EI97DRAFT_278995 [Westerdykella ornata]|uniref:Uncharacterized protein n=1 Tax=Westerdykella ornata TaxID=318751 RepID=A0A6A6JP77_WESOR|nr:uncharacterized protein EI97DRAFT_278995 [Westerdykella ornata]KAF2277943.1 hypothetical protein EI97DRAFT_278995 [Westerdykella ornata]